MKPCKCGNEELNQLCVSRDPLVVTILCDKCGEWTGKNYESFVEAWAAWDALMGEPEAVRNPVAALVAQDPSAQFQLNPWVIMDDGSVFEWIGRWQELQPIPGTAADKERR